MAKNKKSAAKAAKKTTKAKPAAKVKKVAPAKAKKAAAPKKSKPVAKKVAPKKAVEKKKAVVAKKVPAPVKKVAATKPAKPATAAKPEVAHKPAKPTSTPEDKTRYSEEELKEFESLINRKLEKAKEEYRILKDTLNRNNDEGTDATSGGNTKVLEDGAETAEKENLSQLAARQQKYISNLENALIRIKNGTYGICSVTGKLIPKERLIAVPHTTQSIEAKLMQQD
jgi:RNA polymerase-binding transcription factor DksA